MTVGAVLVGAGAGTRLGAEVPKALVRLGDRPLIAHAIARLRATAVVSEIVVTAPAGYGEQVRAAARSALTASAAAASHPATSGASASAASALELAASEPASSERATPELAPLRPTTQGLRDASLHIVEGDFPSRQASVAAGLDRLSTPDAGVVLVHDAARPLAPPAMMLRLIEAVRSGHDVVVPVVPVPDTIRMVDPDDPTRAQGMVDRRHLRAVQTPQAFRGQVLRRVHTQSAGRGHQESGAATDDAALAEALSIPVHLIDGDRAAMKITDRHDLAAAETLLTEGHL